MAVVLPLLSPIARVKEVRFSKHSFEDKRVPKYNLGTRTTWETRKSHREDQDQDQDHEQEFHRNFSLTVASRPQQTWGMQIHIARDGKPVGPFSLEEVNRRLAAGTLSLSDQAWYEGAAGWAPLSTVPGVSSAGPTGAMPSGQPQAEPSVPSVPAAAPASAAGSPVTAIPPPPLPNEQLAVWSLVLSLLAVCGWCCTPVGITAIGGVVCGHLALSRIKAEPRLQGHGLAVAGLIIGYCAIAGWLLKLIFFGGLAATEILKNLSD